MCNLGKTKMKNWPAIFTNQNDFTMCPILLPGLLIIF